MHWEEISYADEPQAKKTVFTIGGRDKGDHAKLIVSKEWRRFSCGKLLTDAELGRLQAALKVSEEFLPKSKSMPLLTDPDAQFVTNFNKERVCTKNPMNNDRTAMNDTEENTENWHFQQPIPRIQIRRPTIENDSGSKTATDDSQCQLLL